MFATYAYARVNQGFGVWNFFLTRSLKISSLSSLSSLKGCQNIEKTGKSGCGFALIILPVFAAILPILPDQINRLADLVAGNENTTTYGKGAV